MSKQFLHMQKLAGLITENEYKNKLTENKYKSKVDWYYVNDYSDYPGPKGRVVPDAEGYDSPSDYEGTELYISKDTIGNKEGEKFVDKEGNDVPFEDQYFTEFKAIHESSLKDKIKELVHSSLGEAKKKKEKPEDVAPQEEAPAEDSLEPTDADMGMDTEVPSVDTGIDIDPKVKNIQDLLQKAYANAKSLGDEKLMTQIGNTITMVVRNQVLGGQAVAESLNEMEDTYSQDEVTNDILNDGIGNKDRGTVFFEAWHLATNSDMTDEEAWNAYTKGDVNIKESLNEDDIFDESYRVSDEVYTRMDNLVGQSDYMNFINSADKIMRNLVSEGFEVKDVYYYLYTRLLADI